MDSDRTETTAAFGKDDAPGLVWVQLWQLPEDSRDWRKSRPVAGSQIDVQWILATNSEVVDEALSAEKVVRDGRTQVAFGPLAVVPLVFISDKLLVWVVSGLIGGGAVVLAIDEVSELLSRARENHGEPTAAPPPSLEERIVSQLGKDPMVADVTEAQVDADQGDPSDCDSKFSRIPVLAEQTNRSEGVGVYACVTQGDHLLVRPVFTVVPGDAGRGLFRNWSIRGEEVVLEPGDASPVQAFGPPRTVPAGQSAQFDFRLASPRGTGRIGSLKVSWKGRSKRVWLGTRQAWSAANPWASQ